MDASLNYPHKFGHATALCKSYSGEIRLMAEYIRQNPHDAGWALNRIALACDALSNLESSAQIALERHIATQAKKVA
jgi:hypothetical protein